MTGEEGEGANENAQNEDLDEPAPEEVIEMNVDKLKKRYPGGEFDVHYSENRLVGDV